MNRLFTIFILSLCALSAYSATTKDRDAELVVAVVEPKEEVGFMERMFKFLSSQKWEDAATNVTVPRNETVRNRRQAYGMPPAPPQQRPAYPPPYPPQQQPGYGAPPARLGNQIVDGGLGADFSDFYDFYPNDFLYDYYDWVCSDTSCQLCNILTSECCDPDVNVNCFLPDSCLNNPCLSGGTCIPTRTIDDRPDFICACYPGFTGKYCQLTNEFFFPPPPPPPLPLPAPPRQSYPPAPGYGQQPPAPGYGQQQPPAPSYNNNNNNQGRIGGPALPPLPPLPPVVGPLPQPRLPVNGVPPLPQPRGPVNAIPQPRI
jgi:hypothetical protein